MIEYNLLTDLTYCKEILDSVSTLIFYTHIPPAAIALFVGVFLFAKRRDLLGALIGVVALLFTAWVIVDLLLWTMIGHNSLMMFLWSLFGIMTGLLFFMMQWFSHAFLTNQRLPLWRVIVWGVALLPVFLLTPTALNLEGFSLHDCSPIEGTIFTNYYYSLGVLAIALIGFSGYKGLRATSSSEIRSAKWIVLAGTLLFTLAFLVTGVLASYLVDSGIIPDFGVEQYGIAAMAAFMGLLAYAVVQYHAFKVQVLGAQALVLALIVLIGSQYTFATDTTAVWLVTVTLVIGIFFGYILVRNVQREIEQREKIEQLAKELEKSNKQQIILIHFITHQIKGFMTKSRNIFSLFLDGDYGPLPDTMRPMIEEGFKSDTKGVNTIQEILSAANIKSGRVTYDMTDVDLKAIIDEVSKDLRATAETKGLAFKLDIPAEPFVIKADRLQILNAFKNLIDNSIKYTLQGSVTISLKKLDGKIRFMVEDTGVGICEEDRAKLFTEGGHGVNSQKVNVESTGFGLYIVKNIIEAHHGKVWAESEGEGKGSRFIAELPV